MEPNMRWKTCVLVVFLGALFSCRAKTYSREENWTRCKGDDVAASIASCTVLIDSGQESPSNLARLYYDRGRAYTQQGKYDRALADYDHAIELSPNYALAFNNRGLVYSDKREYDLAIEDYGQAIRIAPKLGMAFNNRCLAYYKKGANMIALFRTSIRPLRSIRMMPILISIAAW
jgi:tetratricopeptide (TPR) repeat protein